MRVADTPPPHEISSSRFGVSVHMARAETVPPPRAANDADVAGASIEACPGYAPVGELVAVSAPLAPLAPDPAPDAAPDAAADAAPDAEPDAEPDAAGRRDDPVSGDQESAASRKPVPGVPEPAVAGREEAAPVARCRPAEPPGVSAPAAPASAIRGVLGAGVARVLRARSLRVSVRV